MIRSKSELLGIEHYDSRHDRRRIAHAFYQKIPDEIVVPVRQRLPDEFLDMIGDFQDRLLRTV
jgi:hypothetical protein